MTTLGLPAQHIGLLLQTPLFKGLTAAEVRHYLTLVPPVYGSFQKGDYIYRRRPYKRRLGIILEGQAQVKKVIGGGQRIIMNILSDGDLVGGASLFQRFDYYVMEIIATADTKVLFLSQEDLENMFRADYRLAHNYISYLSSRIYFLNHKIDRFTRSHARCRVLNYLADNAIPDKGRYKVCPPYSMKDLAAALNISRATLYRVLDDLTGEGVIFREKNCIYLSDTGPQIST